MHMHAVLQGSGAVGLTNPPGMPGLPPPMPSDKAGLPTASRPGALAGIGYCPASARVKLSLAVPNCSRLSAVDVKRAVGTIAALLNASRTHL